MHGMSNGISHNDDVHGNGGGGGSDAMAEGDALPDHGNLSDNHALGMADHGVDGRDQLTLSFQGQVYVFDSVSAEKVQAVLLLLGGHEVAASTAAVPIAHNNRVYLYLI
uniref:Tify domain-containing protein n=1 Tax=Rhizophora mucronata TaxID=61149 RepID=A0A2P2P255_RHIMU